LKVPAGAAAIPQSTGVALPNHTSTSSSSSSSSSSSTSSPTSTSPTSTLPTSAKGSSTNTLTASATSTSHTKSHRAVAIGVGVAIPIVVVLASVLSFYLWRRRRRQSQPEAPLPELSDPSYTEGTADPEMKQNALGIQNQYDEASPRSNVSELGSRYLSGPTLSLRDTLVSLERKPVPQRATELPIHEIHVDETGVSPNFNEYHGEERPMSSVTTGPLDNMPSG